MNVVVAVGGKRGRGPSRVEGRGEGGKSSREESKWLKVSSQRGRWSGGTSEVGMIYRFLKT